MGKNVNTSQLKALQGEYMGSLAPTADETAASTGLDNILASRDLGIAKVNDQPIASDFVQGQGAGLMRQASVQAQPLEQKLARLQATRQSAADVLKSKLGFETDNVNRKFAEQQAKNASNSQAKTFAEQQRQFDLQLAKSNKTSADNSAAVLKAMGLIMNPTPAAPASNPGSIYDINYNDPNVIFRNGQGFSQRP